MTPQAPWSGTSTAVARRGPLGRQPRAQLAPTLAQRPGRDGLCPTACPRARQAASTRSAAGSRRLELGILAVAVLRAVCSTVLRPRPLDVAAFACWRGRAVARGCPLAGRAQPPAASPKSNGAFRGSACEGVSAGRPARRFAQPFHCSSHPCAPYGRKEKKINLLHPLGFLCGSSPCRPSP